MALCNNCIFYKRSYDEFMRMYDDVIEIGEDEREKHHCSMYDDYIPFDIFYDEKECKHYIQR